MANNTLQSLTGFLYDEKGLWRMYLKIFSGIAGCLQSNSRILFSIKTLHRGSMKTTYLYTLQTTA